MEFKNREPKTVIDMIPLLDSIFILLIFFSVMLVNATMNRKIPVNVPESRTGESLTGNEIMVEILDNGLCIVEGMKYDNETLDESGIGASDTVIIRAGETLQFRYVVDVMDRLNQMGIKDVGIEIRTKNVE